MPQITITSEELSELERLLKPRLTDDFLATLVEAAKVCDSGDYIEIEGFVAEIFQLAGKEPPSLTPYYDDELANVPQPDKER